MADVVRGAGGGTPAHELGRHLWWRCHRARVVDSPLCVGLAVGLSSLNPANPGSARGAGIFTGVWGLIAPLIALFAGGWVAGAGPTSTRAVKARPMGW